MDTLHTLNENIVNLGDSLMRARFGRNMMEKASMDIGQTEHDLKETTDLVGTQNKDQEGVDKRKVDESIETLQDLDKENQ